MLNVSYSNKMKKDMKLIKKRGYSLSKFEQVINILRSEQVLPEKYLDHPLSGNYKGFRECHIEPDWLLIYKIENKILTLILFRTGSHSDLFRR